MTSIADQAYGTRSSSRAQTRVLDFLPAIALGVDTVAVLVAFGLAITGRERLQIFEMSASVGERLGPVGPFMALGWLTVIVILGGYRRELFGSGPEEYRRIVNASLLTAGLVGVACYLAKFPLSRGFFLLLFLVGMPGLLVGRYALRKTLQRARRRGALCNRVLVSGTPDHVDEVVRVLRRESWLGYQVIGAVTPTGAQVGDETGLGVPVLGPADDATAVAVDAMADIIFFAGGSLSSGREMRQRVWELEQHSINVIVAPSVTEISSDRIQVRPVGGLPLLHIDPPAWTDAVRWGKRLFDLVFASALLLVFSPVLLLAAVAVWRHDRGPVLFRQPRTGRLGQEFSCLKVRTMVVDAEERLARLHEEMGFSEGLFKMTDDPRITRPGRWLRRFSLDELPQLWNVIRGDMSLVGPRPPLPSEVVCYDDSTARRLHVRPGMTGLWQVSGRADLSYDEAVRLDLYYVDNWSMVQDLLILARTFKAVVSSRGAY